MTDRKSMAELLAQVTAQAGGHAPNHIIVHPRDWWLMRRGPKWRYPLPPRKRFEPLPARDVLRQMIRNPGLLGGNTRRAFIPSVMFRAYLGYLPLDPWINGERHRGRMQRRVR